MVTIEQIDEFRKRTNSSYSDAKFFLEKNNGDVLDAIIDFERTKTGGSHTRNKKRSQDMGKRLEHIIQKGFDTRVVVEDGASVLFTVPVILLILLIPLWPIAILFFVFLSILGYKFKIQELKSKNFDVNSFFSSLNDKMKEYNSQKNTNSKQSNPDPNSKKKSDGAHTSQIQGKPACTTPAICDNGNQDDEDDNDDDFNEFTVE